jgi:predicted transposase YbfD/YdcC
MKATIFDIDGTLLRSDANDDALYLESVRDVLGDVSLRPSWGMYTQFTAAGILAEILSDNAIDATPERVAAVRDRFVESVRRHVTEHSPFAEMPGARAFVQSLHDSTTHRIAYATGGWREAALLKLSLSGFPVTGVPLATSDDHFDRQEKKKEWLAKFLDLTNGIPSHDTFNAVFALLKPAAFERCLLSWITSLRDVTRGQVLAIDGKTLRGSYEREDKKAAVHMVSVWATANQLSLGSMVVDEKSNEITAIPKLLELIDVSGALVTIDAMGCQKEIARQTKKEGADYVLAVKENQPKLHQAVSDFFAEQMDEDFASSPCRRQETHEKGHGRVEQRYYYLAPVPDDFPVRRDWPHLKALGMAINVTERDGKETSEVRYYILSKYVAGRRFAEAVRSYWSIENHLHWQLDVTFQEDDLRPPGACTGEHEYPDAHGSGLVETGEHPQTGDAYETPCRRMGRTVPGESPYGTLT